MGMFAESGLKSVKEKSLDGLRESTAREILDPHQARARRASAVVVVVGVGALTVDLHPFGPQPIYVFATHSGPSERDLCQARERA